MARLALLPLLLPVALGPAGLASAATLTITWNGGAGDWSDAGQWDLGVVPNNGADDYLVEIDGGAGGTASTVMLDTDPSVTTLTLDAGDTLVVENGRDLTIAGTSLANDGDIQLTAVSSNSELFFDVATLSGNGSFSLSGSLGRNFIEGMGPGSVLSLSGTQVFQGTGGVTVGFAADALDLVVSGTLRATDSTTLRITNVDLSGGGALEAESSAVVRLGLGTTATGLTLSTSGNGAFRSEAVGVASTEAPLLDGVTNTGQLTLGEGEDLRLAGAIAHTGDLRFEAVVGNTEVFVSDTSPPTLSGAGTLTLAGDLDDNFLQGVGPGAVLGVAGGGVQTLRGSGGLTFGFDPDALDLVVDGALRCTEQTEVLLLQVDVSGSGSLEAHDDAGVRLSTGTTITGVTLSSSLNGAFRGANVGSPQTDAALLDGVVQSAQITLAGGGDLRLAGTIAHTGDIRLETTVNDSEIFIGDTAPATLTGSGSFTLAGDLDDNFIEGSAPGATLTVAGGATQTIQGAGGLTLGFGADALDVVVDGALRATQQATVRLLNVDVSGAGALEAHDDALVRLGDGVSVAGVTLATSGNAVFRGENVGSPSLNAALLDAVTQTGQITLASGEDLRIAGNVAHTGDLRFETTVGDSELFVEAVPGATLSGTGTFTLAGDLDDNFIEGSAGGATLTIAGGATQVFAGSGALTVGFVPGNLDVVVDGTLRASQQSTVRLLQVDVAGTGRVEAQDDAVLRLGAGATLTGVTLDSSGNGAIRGEATSSASAPELQAATNSGLILLSNGEDARLRASFTNDGEIRVEGPASNSQLFVDGEVTLGGSGTLLLDSATRAFVSPAGVGPRLVQGAGHTLRGEGIVDVELESAGRLEPGNPIGRLDLRDDLILTPGSELLIDIDGDTPGVSHDVVDLALGRSVTVGGSFFPVVSDDFAAQIQASDQFVVLDIVGTGAPIAGFFANGASGQRVLGPGGRSFTIHYGAGSPFPADQIVLTSFLEAEPGPASIWEFTGLAQGGTVSFTINGVMLEVATTAGQTAEQVAELVSDAIRDEPALFSIPVVATSQGNLVLTDGDVSAVAISDPGIAHGVIPSVPALPLPALSLLAGALVAAARAALRRTRS